MDIPIEVVEQELHLLYVRQLVVIVLYAHLNAASYIGNYVNCSILCASSRPISIG